MFNFFISILSVSSIFEIEGTTEGLAQSYEVRMEVNSVSIGWKQNLKNSTETFVLFQTFEIVYQL